MFLTVKDITKVVPEIDPNEIELKELLGEGSFGKVYRGRCRGQEVGLQSVNFDDVDDCEGGCKVSERKH